MTRPINRKNYKSGFTIIEVLIVLAIAGLILLILFLAVPALQRNSRNVRRARDVALMLTEIRQYATDHGGQFPAGGGSNCSIQDPACMLHDLKLSYYDQTSGVGFIKLNIYNPSWSTPTTGDEVYMYNYMVCTNGIPSQGNSNSIVAFYGRENASGPATPVCIDS